MKSFIKFGNSNTVQRTIIFLGMLLVFFFVVYFVRKYSISEGMAGMTLGTSPPYVEPTPPSAPARSPIVKVSPAPSPTPAPILTPVAPPPTTGTVTGSTTQVVQVV